MKGRTAAERLSASTMAKDKIRPAAINVGKASATLDLYSQAIDESKLAAQRDMALAITSNQVEAN
jgi:hypothetical protein